MTFFIHKEKAMELPTVFFYYCIAKLQMALSNIQYFGENLNQFKIQYKNQVKIHEILSNVCYEPQIVR